jgi:hypothetical protein
VLAIAARVLRRRALDGAVPFPPPQSAPVAAASVDGWMESQREGEGMDMVSRGLSAVRLFCSWLGQIEGDKVSWLGQQAQFSNKYC